MGTPTAEEADKERIMLQLAKMKEPLAAEHPADDEVQQDAVEWKQGVAGFRKRQSLQSLGEPDFLEVFQKDFGASKAGGLFQGSEIVIII